jgi:hypothetical protein
MAILVPLEFAGIVDAISRQREENVTTCLNEAHDWMLRAADRETDFETLARGIYQLRWLLAEGGSLHQWLAMLNRTQFKTALPLTALQREVAFGWLLMLNDQFIEADFAYGNAWAILTDLVAAESMKDEWPSLQQAELDIRIGRWFLRADRHATTADVYEALHVWQHSTRVRHPDFDKRMMLALAALKFGAGMIQASRANADEAYQYFAPRRMNAEAGLAAFYLARYHAAEHGIDLLGAPAAGESWFWLKRSIDHWYGIGLPVGIRLLRPYLDGLELNLPPARLSRLHRHLNPAATKTN